MSKTRIKADPYIVGDLAKAEATLQELAAIERQRRAVVYDMNENIDLLKENAKSGLAPLDARAKALSDALAVFLKMNREQVLGSRKSVDLAFGVIGFRASTSIGQIRGVTAQMSLRRLKDAGLLEGIRAKEELDKDIMRGWPSERLALVGLQRVEKDQFFVELKEEKLGEAAL